MKQKPHAVALGAFAFWLPYVLLSAAYRWSASILALNVSTVASLALAAAVSWGYRQKMPAWNWVLAGVYAMGPAAMIFASVFSRAKPSPGMPGDWIMTVVFCLLPPMTVWLATVNGMIPSVLLVTVILVVLQALGRGGRASQSAE